MWTIDGRTESKEKNVIDMCKPVDENVDSKHIEAHHRIFELQMFKGPKNTLKKGKKCISNY